MDASFDFSVSDLVRVDPWYRKFRRISCLLDKVCRVVDYYERNVGNDPDCHVSIEYKSFLHWNGYRLRLQGLLDDRLDIIYVIPDEVLESPDWFEDAKFLDQVSSEVSVFFAKSHMSGLESVVADMLAGVARRGRVSEYTSRLCLELAEAFKHQRYVLFWTLSCDNVSIHDVFGPGSRCFEIFIEKLKRSLPSGSYFRYFAVPELGDKTGRPHYHMIMFCDSLPSGCVDPNLYFGASGFLREVDGLKRFWSYGSVVSAIAVRYAGDRWSRDGWIWPCVKGKPGVPIKGSRVAMARYLVKYVNKEDSGLWKRRKLKQRVRMSRNFGTEALTRKLEGLSLSELRESAMMPAAKVNCGRLIKRLSRLIALRKIFECCKSVNPSLKTFRDAVYDLRPRMSLYRRLMNSMLGIKDSSEPSVTRFQVLITVDRLCRRAEFWRSWIDDFVAEDRVIKGGICMDVIRG